MLSSIVVIWSLHGDDPLVVLVRFHGRDIVKLAFDLQREDLRESSRCQDDG